MRIGGEWTCFFHPGVKHKPGEKGTAHFHDKIRGWFKNCKGYVKGSGTETPGIPGN